MTDVLQLADRIERAEAPLDFDAAAFGARIATYRKARKMSLQAVGDAAGFAKAHVWELENGRSRNPTVRAVWAFARALGVSPATLLGLTTDEPALHPVAMQIACMVDQALLISRADDRVLGEEA